MTPQTAATDGFPPIEGERASLLILGSLPGDASVRAGQYYAHPRNAFWRIMEELFGASGSYEQRVEILTQSGIVVWDVLASSVRPGSLDSSIRMDTAVVNDFSALFARQPGIARIGCNGTKAYDLFSRFVELPDGVSVLKLPSTSPAHASMNFEAKLARWRSLLDSYGDQ